MSILVTGGAGYIGSHTTIELLNQGYEVIIVDDLSNSSIDIVNRIEKITKKSISLYTINLLDKKALRNVFENHHIESVIHFASYKAVGESSQKPLKYYKNNIVGMLNLCEVMEDFGIFNLIFSSSATVYGIPEKLPITEDQTTYAINPYGRTKLFCEEILKDLAKSNSKWKVTLLRYFNPVGAHPSGEIGENPNGIPNNLMPYITKVAIGELDELKIFGNDYPTKDGTGVRDYIHVVDLAKGHISALNNIDKVNGVEIYNLGTGQGHSVMEVVKTFESVTGRQIPFKIVARRDGDSAISYADTSKANKELKWKAERGLHEMCEDAYNWQVKLTGKSVIKS